MVSRNLDKFLDTIDKKIRRPQVDIDPHVFELASQRQLPYLHSQRGERAVQERQG
jgi:hypothetical protein